MNPQHSEACSKDRPKHKIILLILCPLLAIVLIAGLWLLTRPAQDPAALLEACRLALRDFQNTGSFQTVQESDSYSEEWVVLDTPGGNQTLDQSTRRYLWISSTADGKLYRLHYNGQFLERAVTAGPDGTATDSGWYFADWSGSSSFSAYGSIADLDWDGFRSVTVTDCTQQTVATHPHADETVDATVVVLRMETAQRATEYKFYLDEEGDLFRINTTYLLSNDGDTSRHRLQQNYQDAMADMQYYLEPCLQDLEALKNSRRFSISTRSKESSDPTLHWLRDGENQLTSRFEDDLLTVTMEYDGQCFRREQTYDNGFLIGDSGWYPTEDAPNEADLPQFLAMDWTAATVSNVSRSDVDHGVQLTHPETGETLLFEYDPENGELQYLYFGGSMYFLNPAENAPGSLEHRYLQAVSPETVAETDNEAGIRAAMEFLQSGSYSLVQADKDGTVSTVLLQCFKVGDDMMIQRHDTGEQYLRYNGRDYFNDGEGWTAADLGDLSGIDGWFLDELQMDSPRVFAQPYSYCYRVAVLDETLPKGYYILDFETDDDGNLTGLTRRYLADDAHNWIYTTITIHRPDPGSTSAYLQSVYDEIPK